MPAQGVQSFDTSGIGTLFSAPLLLFWLVIAVASIAGLWMMFEKAGRPGWAAIIPIYNVYVMLKVAGMSGWWLLLVIIFPPIMLWVLWKVAKAYGHGFGYWLGLVFLAPIFYLILGFGSSQYQFAKYERHHDTSGAMPTPA